VDRGDERPGPREGGVLMDDANPAGAICDHERGLCNHWDMQDRIRELETELAVALAEQPTEEAYRAVFARAEKAELRLAELEEAARCICLFRREEGRHVEGCPLWDGTRAEKEEC